MSAPGIIQQVGESWNRLPTEVARGGEKGVAAAAWSHAHEGAAEVVGATYDEHIVSVLLSPYHLDMFIDGRMTFSRWGRSGSVQVVRAGEQPRAINRGQWRVLHIYLPASIVRSIAELHGATSVELIDPACAPVPAIERIGCEMGREMSDGGPISRLRVDLLGQELAVQLLRGHSNLTGSRAVRLLRAQGGLAPWQLKRACDAMAAQLDGGIGLEALASIAGCSPTHFSRAFKQSTGQPPFAWLLHQRIERAKDLLGNPHVTLAEVALAVGFAAQPQFTTAFRRVTGTTPGAWRRQRFP